MNNEQALKQLIRQKAVVASNVPHHDIEPTLKLARAETGIRDLTILFIVSLFTIALSLFIRTRIKNNHSNRPEHTNE